MKRGIWTLAKSDKEFSLWIRKRDGYKCVRCKRQYKEGERGLTNSHFWARQHKGTRFDPLNCDAICWFPCHAYHWEKEKQGDYYDFKYKQLGKARYARMAERARDVYPQDRAIMDCMKLLGALPTVVL
jgi:hypothetical protein